ncbi:Murein DD-endopeptidase MepM and murein hydrolase activator NlpD, contain LysM domain [Pelagibacterium luteolum]|uniref:Murein DD-endopeptidase MepM and murein hydrolase activator NlpD, contain LysM domain n=1 Tax=Pelagibacterium luteolum TaxID=440168 RepID=A0A1G7W3D6_9HYPH|nr:Murein DD-endopeptidase MepM and murein hydrolase activator NlpD, contain LysM domain [Pelagibacterium luteolum]
MQVNGTTISLGRGVTAKPRSSGRAGISVLFGAVGLLLASNVVTGLALFYAPEINALLRDDNSVILTAYEQRITQLRLEVDRLHSRQYAQMGDMNLQMHDLVQQQEVLFEQHEYVRALTEMARELGISSGSAVSDTAATISPPAIAPTDDTAALAQSLVAMQEETRQALVSLSDAAHLSTNEILTGLQPIGIETDMGSPAVGGPFIPADIGGSSIIDEANAVAAALARYQTARQVLLTAPIQTPIAGAHTVTSNFGNRTDPFLKRAAFHAGMDFRAVTGTPVRAAANGIVTVAGTNGGYGKMVEIDHGNGLATRYAHLNQILVATGQTIEGGASVGLSGSTGRSTGPHLHFEVRRGGSAVDPAHFMAAGRNLARYL